MVLVPLGICAVRPTGKNMRLSVKGIILCIQNPCCYNAQCTTINNVSIFPPQLSVTLKFGSPAPQLSKSVQTYDVCGVLRSSKPDLKDEGALDLSRDIWIAKLLKLSTFITSFMQADPSVL